MISLLRPRPFFAHQRLSVYSLRQISTSRLLLSSNANTNAPKIKPSPSLVQKLRTQTSCTIQKAIEALQNSGNNYESALEWLAKDQSHSAQQKARKLSGRVTTNGLIGVSPLSNGVLDNDTEGVSGRVGNVGMPLRAGMVEVNCETDFVARNPVFEKLVRDLAWNVGFYAGDSAPSHSSSTGDASKWIQRIKNEDLEALLNAPMLFEPAITASTSAQELDGKTSIRDAITNTISLVGEKITLKRAAYISAPPLPLPTSTSSSALSVGIYAHNSSIPADIAKTVRGNSGTSAGAVLIELEGQQIIKDLAVSVPGQHTGKPELRNAYRALERALARQVVGYETSGVKHSITVNTTFSASVVENKEKERDGVEEVEGPTPLYAQPFHTYAPLAARNAQYQNVPLENIESALKGWVEASGWKGTDESVNVVGFLKWSIGEDEDVVS